MKKCDRQINGLLLLKFFAMGLLAINVIFLVEAIGNHLNGVSPSSREKFWLDVIIKANCVASIYFVYQYYLKKIYVFFKSKRIDLMIVVAFGGLCGYSFGEISIRYFCLGLKTLSISQILLLSSAPVVLFITHMVRIIPPHIAKLFPRYFKERSDACSSFLSDKEGNGKEDDGFEMLEQVQFVAERIYDNKAKESLIFGIDAPWGSGKSTFINMCIEYWRGNYKEEVIVFSFDVLKTVDRENLLVQFAEELTKEINRHVFVPEIEIYTSKYIRSIKRSKISVPFGDIKMSVACGDDSLNEIYRNLEGCLSEIGKKVIIVIGDLDRLDFSTVKEVLFTIKKIFLLPNVSYVLCYSTENIAACDATKVELEKIIEFMEKFINVKFSVYIENKLLLEYFTRNIRSALLRNMSSEIELLEKAVEGLKDIFESNDFHKYFSFVGTPRKIKRLINTMMLLGVANENLEDFDFDKQDLIHLLLIYIHYPKIFRDIVNSETNGKHGYFSYKQGIGAYTRAKEYEAYFSTMSAEQQFIIGKVFERIPLEQMNKEISSEQKNTFACFNANKFGTEKGNLERYLELILKTALPLKTTQQKFYENYKMQILSGQKTVKDVFAMPEFTDKLENYTRLWKTLSFAPRSEFSNEIAQSILTYFLQEVQVVFVSTKRHSFLIEMFVYMIDKIGWEPGDLFGNKKENFAPIGNFVFGEGIYEKNGILNTLGDESRGVKALFDVLLFRLHCCANRGNGLYNLSSALALRQKEKAVTEGSLISVTICEMREMSQHIFSIFKERYIDKKKNIFEEIENINGADFFKNYIGLKHEERSEELKKIKNELKKFIVFELVSQRIEMGVGCGYYDERGDNDKHGIAESMNKYLFECCLNTHDKFMDYISSCLVKDFDEKQQPIVREFSCILNPNDLEEYWKMNGIEIRKNSAANSDAQVVCNILDQVTGVMTKEGK